MIFFFFSINDFISFNREYKKAGECQKRVTFEECRFDTETMILNGLKLQYQFSYNPFCSYF